MKLSNFVDPTRCWQLLSGVLGIYFSYLFLGLIQQAMLKEQYQNYFTKEMQNFIWPAGFLIFPCGITWLIGSIVNHIQIKPEDRVDIPMKNSAICGLTVAISTLTYTYAIYLTNFPVVMMFKSCNLISVILVGVLCSRVKDKKLKLGTKKIIVGVIVTIGIIMFKVFDPESGKKSQKKTEIIGIVLLIVSLLADGFLPDFQAEIKSNHKPTPMEMMTEINKWVSIISFLYSTALFEIDEIFFFLYQHHFFLFHMIVMGVLGTVGQMFVYRMIKQFKQHFPPFVITTRKIFTVGLSIFYYHHQTNFLQLFGLFLVFALVTYEFVSELVDEKSKDVEFKERAVQNTENNLNITEAQTPSICEEMRQDIHSQHINNIEKQHYNQRANLEQPNPVVAEDNLSGKANEN